jgi:uncharacterized protein with HEPN domain
MPSKRNPVVYLHDILSAIDRVEGYVGGLRFETYQDLWEKQDAVERRLLVLTEAADRFHAARPDLGSEIAWRPIHDLGNVLRHGYDSIECQRIWDIIQQDLPPLRKSVEAVLRHHFPDAPRS